MTIRYANGLDIVERFIGFINCSTSRDAQGLATLILDTLNKHRLGDVPILAQSYDGASVMSGQNRGLQAIIKETHPHAIYIHCLAHKLNLVVVDSCANVSLAKTFFNGLEALYIHFSQPGHHASLKKLQSTLGINTNREMGSLSTTRWSCRYENCKALLTNYEAIKLALEQEITKNRDKHTVEALGLLTIITKPEFVVSLHTFHSVLAIVNVLSKFFQTQNATLGQASDLIESTIGTFEACRNQFKIWTDIEQFAIKQEISLEPVRVSKRRRQQKDFYTELTVGKSNTLDLPADTPPEEYWKINIYYQVVDNIIVNLKRRFENVPLARAVDAFLKLDMKNGEDFINNYKKILIIDTSALEAEAMVMKNMLQFKNDEMNAENFRKHIKKEYCPNLYKLLQAAIVLPVSSAGCERSFSAMRRIKTWLRSTMLQERFSHMSLLNIENDTVLPKFDINVNMNHRLRLLQYGVSREYLNIHFNTSP
ncbi:zinc finger MYM-type protein 1-like [Diprion similis]|uniref:zinc finger MYM-type protein 1-like n=1 Tax=Diprion similis TaxID=362088 RepID=UPI001EF7E4A8|nr:zinc finger MYM-type protein 1-like [Diprion similis]